MAAKKHNRLRTRLRRVKKGKMKQALFPAAMQPRTTMFLCFLCLFVAGSLTTLAGSTMERRFIWNEGNSRMIAARLPKDFILAEETYRKLLDAGVRNGPLFYNLGTALLKAEKYDEAIKAFLRAERYMGSNWDIKRNMLIAIAGKEKDQTVALPWYRFPLFWHYGLAGSTRMTITVCAFAAFWLGLILRALRFRSVAGRIIILSLIVLVLFGSSVATTLELEGRDQRTVNSKQMSIDK